MTDKQRVVVSITGGLVLVVLATWWTNRMAIGDGGWFNYAPDNGPVYAVQRSGGRTALVWTAAIGIWGGGSFWLFRDRSRAGDR